MNLNDVVKVYKEGLSELESMVCATEREVVEDGNLALVTRNINFFTKSFLISVCAHLEICIKELVFAVASDIDSRLSAASIPRSIIEWRYNQKKKAEPGMARSNSYIIGMTKKEVDDLVSGNIYKTREAFSLVGVDLAEDVSQWTSWKELIQAIVTRRNNIVHHNDDASEISLGDVRAYIVSVNEYIDFIVAACNGANK